MKLCIDCDNFIKSCESWKSRCVRCWKRVNKNLQPLVEINKSVLIARTVKLNYIKSQKDVTYKKYMRYFDSDEYEIDRSYIQLLVDNNKLKFGGASG